MSQTKLRLLVVCSRNQRRSLTAEVVFRGHPQIEVRSAGTSSSAKHVISAKDIAWADRIVCMERKHQLLIEKLFPKAKLPPIQVLEISDEYEFMDEELIIELKSALGSILLVASLSVLSFFMQCPNFLFGSNIISKILSRNPPFVLWI